MSAKYHEIVDRLSDEYRLAVAVLARPSRSLASTDAAAALWGVFTTLTRYSEAVACVRDIAPSHPLHGLIRTDGSGIWIEPGDALRVTDILIMETKREVEAANAPREPTIQELIEAVVAGETKNPDKELTLIIPGIRDMAWWGKDLCEVLESQGLLTEQTNFGRFSLFAFLSPLPVSRHKAVNLVRSQVQNAIAQHRPDRVNVIAHSFGTWIFTRLLELESVDDAGVRSPRFVFHRVIFCGSVVGYDFPFEEHSSQFTYPIVNEVGSRDPWPAWAKFWSRRYGAGGTYGFKRPSVKDRWHKGAKHDYFLNREFLRKFWLPYLQYGDIVPDNTVPERPPKWLEWLDNLSFGKIAIPLLLVIFVGSWLIHHSSGIPPETPSVSAASNSRQPGTVDVSRFSDVVHIGRPKDAVTDELGHPYVAVRPSPVLPDGAGDVDLTSVAIERDEEAFGRAVDELGLEAVLYKFTGFVAEVDYIDDVVVQYAILLTEPLELNLTALPDLSWYPDGSSIGASYLSQLYSPDCRVLSGLSSTRDAWTTLSCFPSKFTRELAVAFGHQFAGANLNSVGEALYDADEGRLIGASERIGIDLLHQTRDHDTRCEGQPSEPLVSVERASHAFSQGPLETSAPLQEDDWRLCFSLRLVKPNGIIVTQEDPDRPYRTVALPSGRQIYLDPRMISQGLISYATFGPARDNAVEAAKN